MASVVFALLKEACGDDCQIFVNNNTNIDSLIEWEVCVCVLGGGV